MLGLENTPRSETRFRENHCSRTDGRFPAWATIRTFFCPIFSISRASFLIAFLQILLMYVLVLLNIVFVIAIFLDLFSHCGGSLWLELNDGGRWFEGV